MTRDEFMHKCATAFTQWSDAQTLPCTCYSDPESPCRYCSRMGNSQKIMDEIINELFE